VSVVRSGSLPETAAGVAGADAAPGQPFAPTGAPAPATAAASSRLRGKNVSWQCGLCGYHVLAMDQDGTPLPFATSAFGNVLPLMCPRCKLSHTSWQSSTPFSEQGDHLNLPTTYSNRYKAPNIVPPAGASFTKESGARKDHAAADNSGTLFPPPGHAANASGGRTLLKQRAAGASLSVVTQQRAAQLRPNASNGQGVSSSTRAAVQRRAYYCGHCHRRLLRVDANGELVDMDRDAEGHILPIRCPGCGELHSEWLVKPYAVRR
jgi:rubrerythrin